MEGIALKTYREYIHKLSNPSKLSIVISVLSVYINLQLRKYTNWSNPPKKQFSIFWNMTPIKIVFFTCTKIKTLSSYCYVLICWDIYSRVNGNIKNKCLRHIHVYKNVILLGKCNRRWRWKDCKSLCNFIRKSLFLNQVFLSILAIT